MAKEKFDIIQSTCIPIQIDNCNTDLIIPARYLASTTRDPKFFGDAFMHDLRFDAEGNPVADFVMNQPEYAEAPRKGVHEIIVGGQNWGSGSSREHAAWAIAGLTGNNMSEVILKLGGNKYDYILIATLIFYVIAMIICIKLVGKKSK